MNNDKLSMKEIARLAGTSVATVSRVINRNGRYSKETEQRVLDVINRHDYRPNMLAKSLREDRLKVIGVIVTDLASDYFEGIIREIEHELQQRGYITMLCDTYESEEAEERFIDVLSNLRFSGIIYVGGKRSDVMFKDMPVVYVDRKPDPSVREAKSCYIGSDNYKSGYLAAQKLIASGKREPAIVLFQDHLITQIERLRGYRQALADNGIPYREDSLFHVERVDYENGEHVTREILKAKPWHDAIFYTSDILAIGGVQYLTGTNIRIPEDIAVIGIDDIPRSSRIKPALTTVRQDYRAFGWIAADTMVRLLNGEQAEDKILDVWVVSRQTV